VQVQVGFGRPAAGADHADRVPGGDRVTGPDGHTVPGQMAEVQQDGTVVLDDDVVAERVDGLTRRGPVGLAVDRPHDAAGDRRQHLHPVAGVDPVPPGRAADPQDEREQQRGGGRRESRVAAAMPAGNSGTASSSTTNQGARSQAGGGRNRIG
jgi:hypothetical protein